VIVGIIQPFDPGGLALAAILNPVVVAVALWLGWQANQWQKLVVAGFAAACAGAVAVWLGTAIGLISVHGYGGVSGVFAISFVYGIVLAGVAYGVRRARHN